MIKRPAIKDQYVEIIIYIAFGACTLALLASLLDYFTDKSEPAFWEVVPWYIPVFCLTLFLEVLFIQRRKGQADGG